MVTKVAINGFGRIGRLALRAIVESKRKDIEVVAINDLGTSDFNAHLLQYDSVHGQFPYKVKSSKTSINAGLGPIKIFSERNPEDLPWKKLGVDVVMECTGIFTDKAKASLHINAGAKRVLISAPSKDADITVVYGVNHQKIRKSHKVISNASCTTNCLAPVAMVLDKLCGINQGYMTTVHAFTGDQAILDTLHSDKRRARSASQSIIPTSTGAAKAVGLVLPQLAGKLDGTAVRVPTPNVSMIDLVFNAKKKVTVEEINKAMIKVSSGSLKGVLNTSDEPLVSIDYNHNPASSTFDLTQTEVIGGKLGRVLSWYDNEWGFANRMSDTASIIGKLIKK
ncbi:type I glyceraldehyde-3-phosphate dehydrogenase [Hyphomicrobiales bacterium]|jgi:glyceraldehyde 3-phosphate dehydrogenase|nr:type I glyceraldehyde-3-phosphate dehydrogenase [Alphaproteobacteria bacterium]MDC0474078.1 type I glyceraldehyde-3-phosphate dehydrogenase [Hyphomicrobiales bacterium]MDG1152238.1 type I glyceraldehyde-3-phosphate dehydrogenase [Hyphomicrobiales bacterium]MDG1664600.1 type I glyceraldehyde-3-phosphate dehydrogenase [Hyphomicrobiales bacterium]MDG2414196.1 type I glyceraldehyde-3-phosphate dehydrogenase [Hyphomicrobiales bacterium]|tara:strand:- start:173 stop:1186 length:1014 start_codon:yes stop_codon:yes gene_type:complete